MFDSFLLSLKHPILQDLVEVCMGEDIRESRSVESRFQGQDTDFKFQAKSKSWFKVSSTLWKRGCEYEGVSRLGSSEHNVGTSWQAGSSVEVGRGTAGPETQPKGVPVMMVMSMYNAVMAIGH